MNKAFVALLLLVGAAAMVASSAIAQEINDPGAKLANPRALQELIKSRAARAHVSADGDPDTVWFGHSVTNHNTTGNNPWNLYIGSNLPGEGLADEAIWGWDDQTGIAAVDSLQGWWPIRRAYNIGGGLTLPDASRAWWAVDIGNQVNYVLNAHGGRTKGVVGVWHSDGGNTEGAHMSTAPITGTRSAWCGLRAADDVSNMDPITHNAFNASTAEFVGETSSTATGTNKNLPGYLGQWDQMLYRDFNGTSGAFTVAFKYRTRMSTGVTVDPATRTGWFHGDPLSVTVGNFISSSDAGSSAPIDSFMVYVGAPVNDASCVYSDGVSRPVYDPQRRWFSEVLRLDAPYNEIFSQFGSSPADSNLSNSVSPGVTSGQADAIRNATGNTGHTIRVVFRVKTNRGFDDGDSKANGFTSGSCGAATVDDVSINGGAAFGFEAASDIDNSTGVAASATWKSTGKPPAVYFHLRDINDLTYHDLCGAWNSSARFCDIGGAVMSSNNFDDFEKSGDSRFTSDREVLSGMMSPTIDLVTAADSSYNEQGLRIQTVDVLDDYYLWYDLYAGQFNLVFTGNAYTFGTQAYPAIQQNGIPAWGDMLVPTFQIFNPEPQCYQDIEPLFGNGVLAPAPTASGYPDSLRLFMGVNQQCFRFGVSLGCNTAEGAYFDNLSLAFSDAASGGTGGGGLGSISGSNPWTWINDAFPKNETPGLAGTANFDTAGTVFQTGINIAQSTGNELRYDIPGDTIYINGATATGFTGPNGNATRMDMVFRILPGPGNYQIAGVARNYNPTTGALTGTLLQVPQNQANVVVPGDGSFWGQFIADPGTFGTVGGHGGGTAWDNTTWNSARCDTAEMRIFPVTNALTIGNTRGSLGTMTGGASGTGRTAARYINTLHESDPKFATLGQLKNKCFVVSLTAPANQLNIVCDGTVPAWVTGVGTGYDGNAQTREFTKIIPDGLLTPGSHVQYFFRKSIVDDPVTFVMCPDTNFVTQGLEGSTDAHRWQEFSALPDRWKAVGFGGAGPASMLFVDNADRRGDEAVFVSIMDSLGGTAQVKWGAHNGWHAAGGGVSRNNPAFYVNRNSQPGSSWDMYGVKASESITTSSGSFGSRYASRAGMTTPPMSPKYSTMGPTQEMLRTYYRMLVVLTGDLTSAVWGPFGNRGQDDVTLVSDFCTTSVGTAQPRGLLIMGDGFVQSEHDAGLSVDPTHTTFLNTKLGVDLRSFTYQQLSGNGNLCADLKTTTAINADQDIYGIGNQCLYSTDVMKAIAAITEEVPSTNLEAVGVNAPYIGGMLKPSSVTRPWIAETEGYQIRHVWSRYCDSDQGRLGLYYKSLNKAFSAIAGLTGTASQTLGVPQNQHGGTFVNFMRVGNSVMRSANASIHFGLANSDRVKIRMYDVTGRQVRTLADRSFNAGEYNLSWDGTDDGGVPVARGVYFARIEYAAKGNAINGRVVVLR